MVLLSFDFRMRKDENTISAIQETVNLMINPFTSSHTELLSLSSGAIADEETKMQLLNSEQTGESRLKDFLEQRVAGTEEEFFATVKSCRLKTFASMSAKARAKKTGSDRVLKSDRALFVKLLLVAKERDIDLKDILCYSLSEIPGSLANADGTGIAKTVKSTLLKHLEELTPTSQVTTKPDSCALVIDAMALIQSFPHSKLPETYGQLSLAIFRRLTQLATQFGATRVDIVGDRYDNISIKNVERDRRNSTAQEIKIYSAEQKRPTQWKKFLGCGKNKQALQDFLAQQFTKVKSPSEMIMYVALKSTVQRLDFKSDELPLVQECPLMESDHEEADTRLVLHAKYCSELHDNVVIWSPDTDVAVIGITHASHIDTKLLFATGTGKHQRLISLSNIADNLGEAADALAGFHALTGCDTTSSFYGKGKKAMLNLLLKEPIHIQSLALIGRQFELPELSTGIEKYVCSMYNDPSSSVNEARYKLFRTGTSSDRSLPPNQDALKLHVMRANYQCKIWRSAIESKINCPSPHNYGWIVEDETIRVLWLDQPYAPPNILKTIKCSCKSSRCKSGKCACRKQDMKCTALCMCSLCENGAADKNFQSDTESEDSEKEDSDDDM